MLEDDVQEFRLFPYQPTLMISSALYCCGLNPASDIVCLGTGPSSKSTLSRLD